MSIRRYPWIISEWFGLLAINSQLYTTVGKQCTTSAKGRSEIGLFDYRASAKFETWFHLKQEPCCIIGPYKYTLKKAGAKTWSWITRNDISLRESAKITDAFFALNSKINNVVYRLIGRICFQACRISNRSNHYLSQNSFDCGVQLRFLRRKFEEIAVGISKNKFLNN